MNRRDALKNFWAGYRNSFRFEVRTEFGVATIAGLQVAADFLRVSQHTLRCYLSSQTEIKRMSDGLNFNVDPEGHPELVELGTKVFLKDWETPVYVSRIEGAADGK